MSERLSRRSFVSQGALLGGLLGQLGDEGEAAGQTSAPPEQESLMNAVPVSRA
jgi:hypothetical protein